MFKTRRFIQNNHNHNPNHSSDDVSIHNHNHSHNRLFIYILFTFLPRGLNERAADVELDMFACGMA